MSNYPHARHHQALHIRAYLIAGRQSVHDARQVIVEELGACKTVSLRKLHNGLGMTGSSRQSKYKIQTDIAGALAPSMRVLPSPPGSCRVVPPQGYTGSDNALDRDAQRHAAAICVLCGSRTANICLSDRNLDEDVNNALRRAARSIQHLVAEAGASNSPSPQVCEEIEVVGTGRGVWNIAEDSHEALRAFANRIAQDPSSEPAIPAPDPSPHPQLPLEPPAAEPTAEPVPPEPVPAATAEPDAGDGLGGALLRAIEPTVTAVVEREIQAMGVTAETIDRRIAEQVAGASIPRTTRVTVGTAGQSIDVGVTHPAYDDALALVAIDRPIYLHGPAGSGKSHLAGQIARALDLPLVVLSGVEDLDSFEFAGYKTAGGDFAETEFYRAWCGAGEYDGGALIFIDEFDRLPGGVSVRFNEALSDTHEYTFAIGSRSRHARTRIITAGNTLMLGASTDYASAQRQDGSTRDRLMFVAVDYDLSHEDAVASAIAADVGMSQAAAMDWVEYVRAVRGAVRAISLDYIVSPRASYDGIRLIGGAGLSEDRARDYAIWSKLPPEDHDAIKAQMHAGASTGGK